MALRADPAPTAGGALTQDMEIAVAAGKMRVIAIGFGKLPRHCKFTEWAQQGVIPVSYTHLDVYKRQDHWPLAG